MLLNLKFNIFFSTLIAGTLIACSASSWLVCWLGLEINLMSLIPLILSKSSPTQTETAIKYFLAQAIASVMIIFSSSFLIMSTPSNSLIVVNSLILTALFLKMAAAPFHFWLPQVIQSSSWSQACIIFTWQKIAPMSLISFSNYSYTLGVIILSSIIGVMGGINQKLLKKILAYSAILHSAWILAANFCSEMTWMVYLTIYSGILVAAIYPLHLMALSSIKEINLTKMHFLSSFMFFLNFFSLAGIPPLLGFGVKLFTIITLIGHNFFTINIVVLIMSSLTALFFYLRVMYSSLLAPPNNKIFPITFTASSYSNRTFVSLSILGNLTLPFILLLT